MRFFFFVPCSTILSAFMFFFSLYVFGFPAQILRLLKYVQVGFYPLVQNCDLIKLPAFVFYFGLYIFGYFGVGLCIKFEFMPFLVKKKYTVM